MFLSLIERKHWRSHFASICLALCGLVGLGQDVQADDWPQWLGPQRDGVWREKGIVKKFPKGGPKVLWRIPIQGGYAGPAVAKGKVYVTDRVLAPGESDPRNPFARSNSKGTERILCLDQATGKQVWKYEYDCTYRISYAFGPRATPVVHEGKVYTLGAMGDLYCLDATTGKKIWNKNFVKEYDAPVQIWGAAAHPLIDGDRLICVVGGKGSVAVAFDKNTGAEKWKALSMSDGPLTQGYCPPMIYEVAGQRQLIIWHSEAVNGLNPETGKVYWSVPFRSKASLAIPTPRFEDNRLFVTAFYNGSLMLQMNGTDKPRVLWRSRSRAETPKYTTGLHSIMCTPFCKGDYIYGVGSYGELRCLEAKTGQRKWATLKATTTDNEPTRWANAFIIAQGDRYFLFNEKGDLIIAKLTPKGYNEIDRAHILDPTSWARRKVVWSHPAFANQCMYARNDKEIVCVSLAENEGK